MKNERKSFIPLKKIYGDQPVNFAREHYGTNTIFILASFGWLVRKMKLSGSEGDEVSKGIYC